MLSYCDDFLNGTPLQKTVGYAYPHITYVFVGHRESGDDEDGIIMSAVTTTVTFPVTPQDDIRWSTTDSPSDVELRQLYYDNATESDVTARNNVTVYSTTSTANATKRPPWTYYPFPYDPMLGWYTAAMISGFILVFLLCEGMNRLKRAVIDYYEAR